MKTMIKNIIKALKKKRTQNNKTDKSDTRIRKYSNEKETTKNKEQGKNKVVTKSYRKIKWITYFIRIKDRIEDCGAKFNPPHR